ncbi:magnesium transporter [Propionibacterium cyclohexanicum]|uniref:Magnesium transporter n=2 Tax=Propionibacterium cyclohexanicum TaxID=64702 RepID=A0A1H9QI65_9ACTN|nr:magnesium transporter [Propionibacterium cyclohexanicum]
MATVQNCVWRDGRLVEQGFPLDQLSERIADGANLVWLDFLKPQPRQLTELARELGFDLHSVEDALAPRERAKAVRHESHWFILVHALRLVAGADFQSRIRAAKISAFALPNALITVRTDPDWDMGQVVRRWETNPRLVEMGTPGLLHGLLDTVVDGHFEVIERLDDSMEELEDLLFEEEANTRTVQRLTYQLRRELVEVRRICLPMREVVASVIRGSVDLSEWVMPLRGYYEDLHDHVQRESEWTESLRDLVSSIYETNISLADTRMNVVMKQLSGWAAIIAVPTFITGWFGQNVPFLGFGTSTGVWVSTGLIAVCVAVLYGVFKSKDWI